MFSVYGISGPIFQGSLEKLGQVTPILRSDQVIATRRIGDQAEVINPELGPPPGSAGGTSEQAVDAYQAMLPKDLERGPLYQADQLMQRQIITVNVDDDVAGAWRILVDRRIHQAPVLDSKLNLVGIISERNLLTTLNVDAAQLPEATSRRVGEVMTTPVVAATPMTDIRRIANVMLERNVEGVPIVNDGGTLVGFISRGDILRAVVTEPPLSLWR